MPVTKRRRKRKPVRFKIVSFKVSAKQKRSLLNYCKARGTTPIKLIKKNIQKYLDNFALEVPEQYFVTEKQLDLFREAGPAKDQK
jgi:hypothetical protein